MYLKKAGLSPLFLVTHLPDKTPKGLEPMEQTTGQPGTFLVSLIKAAFTKEQNRPIRTRLFGL